MRKLLILLNLLLLIGNQRGYAQVKGFQFDLSGGLAIPKSQLAFDTSMIHKGPQTNAGLSYLGKNLGLGLQGGAFKNPLSPDFLRTFGTLPAASELQFTNKDWRSIYGGIGPVFRLGSRSFDWQLRPVLGLIKTASPVLDLRSKAISQGDTGGGVALEVPKPRTYWSVGTKLQWQLSNRLGLHLKADYLSINGQDEEVAQQVADGLKNLGLRKGIEGIRQLTGQVSRQKNDIVNFGAGLTFRFGDRGSSDAKSEASCEATSLLSPINGSVFLIDGELRPDFNWQNPHPEQVAYYLFRIYRGDELVYEEKTQKSDLGHNEEMEIMYLETQAMEQRYTWDVTTYFDNCEALISDRFSFVMSNRSGSFHDIFDLECDDPAFTDAGDQRFIGKISFFNNISTSDPLIISSFSDVIIQDASGNPIPGVALSNITDCVSTLPVSLPIIVPPGGTQTYCFELVVPSGYSVIRSEAHGSINSLPQMSTDQDDLPKCTCTVCDSWRFSGRQSSLSYVANGGTSYNAMLLQDIQIANADPIKEVKAEIVYVSHVANDPQCYTCTKHDNDMGLFSFQSSQPMVAVTNGNWKNNKFGYKGPGDAYDTNNDQYVNQVLWKADDPVIGVDFSSTAHRFRMPINLPEPSSLDCCDHRYQVCVRYTFTDVNCVTCDYLVCYRMSPGSGTGVLDPATGVQIDMMKIDPRRIPRQK